MDFITRNRLVKASMPLWILSVWSTYSLAQDSQDAPHNIEVLPKAEVILDRYVEVTGGKPAYARLHTQQIEGQVQTGGPSDTKSPITIYRVAPNKYYEVVSFGLLAIARVSNGETAWQENGDLPSVVMGRAKGRLREYGEKDLALYLAAFNPESRWRDLYSEAETRGIKNVGGSECYEVALVLKTGPTQTKYFDKNSGLLVKTVMMLKVPKTGPPTSLFAAPVPKIPLEFGELPWELTVSDYRKERDILMPHQSIERVGGRPPTITTIDRVDQNASISDEQFDLPAGIQALLKQPAAR